MKSVAIAGSMQIDLDVIERIAVEQLGMQRTDADPVRPPPPLDPFEIPRIPQLDQAIADVIKATDKLDRDQFTSGEQSAMSGLFRAAKQLRLAVRQLKSITPEKGKSNV